MILLVDDIVSIEHGSRLMAGYLHTIVLIIPSAAEISDTAPAHVMRNRPSQSDLLASTFESPTKRFDRFAFAVKDESTIGETFFAHFERTT